MANDSGSISALDRFTENLNNTIQHRQRNTFGVDEANSKPQNLTTSYMKNNYSKQFDNFNEAWTDQANPESHSNIGSIYQDENLTLSLTFFINQKSALTHKTSINRNRKVSDLWTESMSILSQIHYDSHSIQDLKIYHEDTQLLMFQTLNIYNLTQGSQIQIYLTIPEAHNPNPDKTYIQKHLLPKIDYTTYKTNPTQIDLFRMSENEISRVKNFEIFNAHGKVRFLQAIDLKGVDFEGK
jgi:hypothetical protein